MSLVVDEHREFLADRVRLDAYQSAIRQLVRPGDVVVDLGSGTGILGLFACRAGAARVYAVEPTGLIELARALAAENGVADRMHWIHRHAIDARLPERADVLVGDFAGRMGFEAGVFDLYAGARRWLKPDARIIPSAITIQAAPVEDAAGHAEAMFWSAPVAGFQVTSALRWSLNTGYPRTFAASQLLSDAPVAAAFETTANAALLRVQGRAAVTRDGTVHGIAAWFSAALADGVVMTNDPRAAARINRRNVYLPLTTALTVRASDVIDIDLRIRPADMLVAWNVAIHTGGVTASERHSTLSGMLIAREDLRATDPAARPRLTPRGEARRTLLELFDGVRSLREIEQGVFDAHRDLFATAGEAAAFVAEVVTRYAEFD